MFFFVITKNLNWELLSKNLVTFILWVGLSMKNLILWGFTEKSEF